MVMSQPLVENQKAIKDLNLPVLDFFILGEVTYAFFLFLLWGTF